MYIRAFSILCLRTALVLNKVSFSSSAPKSKLPRATSASFAPFKNQRPETLDARLALLDVLANCKVYDELAAAARRLEAALPSLLASESSFRGILSVEDVAL